MGLVVVFALNMRAADGRDGTANAKLTGAKEKKRGGTASIWYRMGRRGPTRRYHCNN